MPLLLIQQDLSPLALRLLSKVRQGESLGLNYHGYVLRTSEVAGWITDFASDGYLGLWAAFRQLELAAGLETWDGTVSQRSDNRTQVLQQASNFINLVLRGVVVKRPPSSWPRVQGAVVVSILSVPRRQDTVQMDT